MEGENEMAGARHRDECVVVGAAWAADQVDTY